MSVLTIDHITSKKLLFLELVRDKFNIENPMISWTDIRAEALLNPSKNSYKMKLKDIGAPTSDLESRLDDNQLFLPVMAAVNIQRINKDSEAAGAPDYDANYPLWTYADRNFFSGASNGSLEATALEKIWQGKLSISKGGNDLVRGIMTHQMKYVPQNQYVPATVNSKAIYPQYGPGFAERGYHPLYTDLVLVGGEDNNAMLELGAGNINLIEGGVDDQGASTKFCNKLVVLFKGFWFYGDDFGNTSGVCMIKSA